MGFELKFCMALCYLSQICLGRKPKRGTILAPNFPEIRSQQQCPLWSLPLPLAASIEIGNPNSFASGEGLAHIPGLVSSVT